MAHSEARTAQAKEPRTCKTLEAGRSGTAAPLLAGVEPAQRCALEGGAGCMVWGLNECNGEHGAEKRALPGDPQDADRCQLIASAFKMRSSPHSPRDPSWSTLLFQGDPLFREEP